MPLVVVGLNHKTAPVALLERLSITDDRLVKALHQLATFEHVLEGVVLSTCNRIEVYASVSKFHGGAQDLRNFLAEFCHVAPEDFVDHLYTYHDDAAVRHLFRVASGIDSMVIGESEILGQVRRALQVAGDEGTVHRSLGAAFRRALHVGKRARTETAIGRNPVSISTAAVDLARRAFGGASLEGKRVAIIGAGKMGRLAARALSQTGARDIVIVNRSEERGRDLARDLSAAAVGFDRLESALADADIVLCSTTAPETIIERPLLERVASARGPRGPLFIVDIAVPRDVDPFAAAVSGVVLRDIDDLREVVEANIGTRRNEVVRVEDIIEAELERFVQWDRSTDIAPTLAKLVERAEAIRRAETEKLLAGRGQVSPQERDALERMTKRIVARLLHEPLTRARELGTSKQGVVYLAALRELFELGDDLGP